VVVRARTPALIRAGLVFIIDRVKDLVIRGGENISCAEVEDCVYSFHNILEVAAFGLLHERLGEQLCVAIVPLPGASLDGEQVKAWCSKHLAKFKVPSMVFVRTAPLPRGGTGKVLKRELRKEYQGAA
jgi:long-chain acyl-CoA synthetase